MSAVSETASAHAAEEPSRVERDTRALEGFVGHEVAARVEDVLHDLGRAGAEAGPHRMAVDDRVLDHDVRTDGDERAVQLELPIEPGPVRARPEHEQDPPAVPH